MLRYEPKFVTEGTNSFLYGPTLETVRDDIVLAFHKDVEGKIRQALIDLGWTPPPNDVLPDSPAPPESVQKSSRNG